MWWNLLANNNELLPLNTTNNELPRTLLPPNNNELLLPLNTTNNELPRPLLPLLNNEILDNKATWLQLWPQQLNLNDEKPNDLLI
jgi:hypothetical protein